MGRVFLATLGQRPEAITVAYDLLSERHHYECIGILHTDAHSSGIATALANLKVVLARDYPKVQVFYHELRRPNGGPLIDVVDAVTADDYYSAVYYVLREYRHRGQRIHLLVSGGRKAMSIYAMLAATLLFDPPHDHVWVVLSPESMVAASGQFHIPPGLREQVQIVSLPLVTARTPPNGDPLVWPGRHAARREQFLEKLTHEERRLVQEIHQRPYASNAELAAALHKSTKTVENQLSHIYDKLIGFLDAGETISSRKLRQALIDLLNAGE